MKQKLVEERELEEIKEIVFAMKNNKSPGQDMYGYEFFKVIWEERKYMILKTYKQYLIGTESN